MWHPTDTQMSQAIPESVSNKGVSMGKTSPICVQRFAGSLDLFSILPGKGFIHVSDVHHKVDFIFLTFFGLF